MRRQWLSNRWFVVSQLWLQTQKIATTLWVFGTSYDTSKPLADSRKQPPFRVVVLFYSISAYWYLKQTPYALTARLLSIFVSNRIWTQWIDSTLLITLCNVWQQARGSMMRVGRSTALLASSLRSFAPTTQKNSCISATNKGSTNIEIGFLYGENCTAKPPTRPTEARAWPRL